MNTRHKDMRSKRTRRLSAAAAGRVVWGNTWEVVERQEELLQLTSEQARPTLPSDCIIPAQHTGVVKHRRW
jgi:hypothetical protein